tara:strand:- start:1704 stop:3056 length:1353 start_codon:yes stop_codon:yes gene_type:complete
MAEGLRRVAGKWAIYYRAPNGRQVQETVGTSKREALRLRKQRLEEIERGVWVHPRRRRLARSLTLERFGEDEWLPKRAARRVKVRSIRDDRSRLRHHVYPVIGHVDLQALHVEDLRRLMEVLRTKPSKQTGAPLAEKTQFNVMEVVRKMLSDAERHFGEAGIDWRSPWYLLDPDNRPQNDSPEREAFTRPEAEALISDDRIGFDRRVLYAGPLFTGMRFGEWAGLRWGDIDASAPELARIRLVRQVAQDRLKESRRGRRKVRLIPVHPELAKLLEEWRRVGWPALYARFPSDGDYIVPSSHDARSPRKQATTWRQFKIDCRRVGVRPLTFHCTRNTFLTLATEDSPELEHVIKTITHSAKGASSDRYIANRWRAQCQAVAAFDLRRDRRASVSMLTVSLTSNGGGSDALVLQGESSAGGGTRTRMCEARAILNRLRMPIPPPRLGRVPAL